MTESEFLIPCADRVANLPAYVFATVFRLKEEALATGREVIEFFQELNRDDGVTLLLVTHESRVSRTAERTITIEDGKILDGGDIGDEDEVAS